MQTILSHYTPPPLSPLPARGNPLSPRAVYEFYLADRARQQNGLINYLHQVVTLLNTGTQGFGPDLVAAPTLVLTAYQHVVTQTATIINIKTGPGLPASHVTLISQDGFTIQTGGNIASPKAMRAKQALMLVWNPVTQLWYPIVTIADLSDLPDDPTNQRFAVSAIDANRRALIDFTQPGHIGQVLPRLFDYTAVWQALQAYTISTYITDSNGNIQQLVTAGTSGAAPPTWSVLLDGLTTDGSAVWENVGGIGAASIILQSPKYLLVETHQATPAEIQFGDAAGVVVSKITAGANPATDLSVVPATTATGMLALGDTNTWNTILQHASANLLLRAPLLTFALGTAGATLATMVPGAVATADIALEAATNGVGVLSLGRTNKWASVDVGAAAVNLSGKIAHYGGIATVSGGAPAEYATADSPGQTAAIAPTTIYAVPAAGGGMYRISYVATVTTGASVSSVLGGANGLQVIYTNADGAVVVTTPVGPTSALNTTQAYVSGVVIVQAAANTNIQYSFGYTSAGTPMAFALHVKVEAL